MGYWLFCTLDVSLGFDLGRRRRHRLIPITVVGKGTHCSQVGHRGESRYDGLLK